MEDTYCVQYYDRTIDGVKYISYKSISAESFSDARKRFIQKTGVPNRDIIQVFIEGPIIV